MSSWNKEQGVRNKEQGAKDKEQDCISENRLNSLSHIESAVIILDLCSLFLTFYLFFTMLI